jgi:hypothetical protein
MGVSADLYNERMRGPEPDQGDEVVMALAVAMRGKHERQERRQSRWGGAGYSACRAR